MLNQLKPDDIPQPLLYQETFILLGLRKDQHYLSGGPPVLMACLYSEDGYADSEWCRVSVNITTGAMPSSSLPEDHFYIKNWTEGEPMYRLLIDNGILMTTGITAETGMVSAPCCKLTEKGVAWCLATEAILGAH